MAKQIKTIQCPQCGSAQQSKIKEDHYKCGSCGAEYFLDNDDINVNVKHQYDYQQDTPTPNKKLANILTICTITIISIIGLVVYFINTSTNPDDVFVPSSANINDRIEGTSLPPFSHNALSFYVTKRIYGYSADNDSRNGHYAIFYDLENKKKLKESRLDIANIRIVGSAYTSLYFPSMNKTFGIINKSRILDIDFEQMTVKDVTEEILSKYKEFNSGIATVEFTNKSRGEGFKIMTNLGLNITYYPSLDLLVQDNDRKQTESKVEPIEKTFYTFTRESSDYPSTPIQLMKITYFYNNGGPENKPNYLSWRTDYWSKKTNGEYDKSLISKNDKTVKEFEDFTPGRIYFKPKVLYQTEKELLIKFNPTLAPDAPTTFQLLDIETKEPKWTKQITKDIYVTNVSLTDKYFIILQYSYNYYFLPLGGGEIESFEMPRR